jgi:predicted acylesterase/phospholipase RssA
MTTERSYAYRAKTPHGTLIIFVALLLCGCDVLPGHWRPGWNERQPDGVSTPETAASWRLGELETKDGRFVALTISGGGSRAANFGAAAMLELQKRGWLDQVDVMSGVSGGTLPIAYYALGPDKTGPFTDQSLRDAFEHNFQRTWLWRWLLPHNIFRYWLSDFTRSDIMVQVFNNRLYHEATFADLRPHPKILINATARNDHTRFTFTDDRFRSLRSNLAAYHVANAVNASSAFPALFDDVTLEHYSTPSWYVHLYDGGPIDNLGVQAVLEFLSRVVPGTALDKLFPNGCVIFVVDAATVSENESLSQKQSSRTWVDYFVNTNALDAVNAMLNAARRNLLADLGLQPLDRKIHGAIPISGQYVCQCEVRHIALRHLLYADREEDEQLAARVTTIATKFWVSPEEQADLFQAAAVLMKEMDEYHLLPDDKSLTTACAGRPPASEKTPR